MRAEDSSTKQVQIERLNTAFADGSIELAEFKELKNSLVPQKVGLNRIFRDQTLTVSFSKPRDSLAQTNLAVLRTADELAQSEKWWR